MGWRDWRDEAWIWLASIAGAVTAMSFQQYKDLTWRERSMLVFVGIVFAVFVGPLIVGWLFGAEKPDSKIVGASYYIIAMSANVIIPKLLKAVEALAGKTRLGPDA